jgi:hypothetical protein
MKKVLVVLMLTVMAVFAFAADYTYTWHSAPVCGNKSGTLDSTFINADGYSHPYGVAVADNDRIWSSSYYGTQRYDAAIMVWDPVWEMLDTVGPEIEWDGVADTIGLCRFMQTTGDGNVAYGDWTNDMITVFDDETYDVVARSEFGPNTGGGMDAFVYNGEQYYVTQQILGSTMIIWDADFYVVDTLNGGGGGRNCYASRDGSLLISPSLGGQYFVEWAGNPDDGYVGPDTVYLEDINVNMDNLMYVSRNGTVDDNLWLFSRDAANDGVYVVDPYNDYATLLYTNTDSSVEALEDFPLGMAVDNQFSIWLENGLVDSADVYTPLGYHTPWQLRSPCQVATYVDATSGTEYLYLADFYGFTLKVWEKVETAVEDIAVVDVDGFVLDKAYPNPFNPATTIPYTMTSNGNVSIDVYDVAGKKVQSLVNEYKLAGNYEVTFNAGDLASGNYVVKMTVGDKSLTQKISLLK